MREAQQSLLVCADDFGMNPAIDAAVLELAAAGRLQATSCMADGPSLAADAPALLASGLQTGLHLNFTEKLAWDGLYLPLGALLRASWLRRLDRRALQAQIARQLDGFEDAFGRAPHFVDGHQHVHQVPQIRELLLAELGRRYPGRLPWLRRTTAGKLAGLPWRLRAKARLIGALGAGALARQAQREGYALNRRFLGAYDFQGGAAAYARWLAAWRANAQPGDLMMCHPATAATPGDALGAQRVAEFEVLMAAPPADGAPARPRA